jgi:acyl-CoA thioester hydrolase
MTEQDGPDLAQRAIYRLWTPQQIRFADVDAQLHVNNVAFCTYLESGRVHCFVQLLKGAAPEGTMWVLKQMELDYRGELNWPGEVEVGTVVTALGRSSVTIGQGIFAVEKDGGGRCAAVSSSVCVLLDKATRRSTPMPDDTRARFEPFVLLA